MTTPATPLRLLLVEDSESDAGLLLREFLRAGVPVEHERVQDEPGMRAALAHGRWDAIICDYSMPGFSAIGALELLEQSDLDLPFLVVSGSIPEGAAVELMRQGAHDYLLKDNLARMVPATMREIREAEGRRSRRLAEQSLRENAERLRLAQQVAGIGVFDVDLVRDHAVWTEEEEAIFGLKPGEFDHTGATFWSLIHPDDRDRVRAAVDKAIAGHIELDIEFRLLPRDGRVRWVASLARVYYDESGRAVRLLGVDTDITARKEAEAERRRLEEQLRQGQKMEAIGQLSGGVAHDFNNLLTVILGNVMLIEHDEKTPRSTVESLAEIKDAARRAANLTRQLLAFSRKQPMRPADLDLNIVVADMVRMLRRILGEDIQLDVVPAPEPAIIRADVGMIEQVLLNLAVNARDAMPGGGRLVLQTGTAEVPRPLVPPGHEPGDGRFVTLFVTDTGCGIAPDVMPRIFDPFFTTKDVGHGTGLGLATVYGIVEQHGGWVHVTSEVGHGSVFRVFLPRRPPGAFHTPRRPETASPRTVGRDRMVLLVEDEASVRSLARRALTDHGFRVLEAPTGPTALELWTRHHHEIDLLLTDLVMPDGMNGLELARRLIEDKPELRVIYTSGHSNRLAAGDPTIQEGVNFLPKPYDPDSLLRLIG